MRSCGASLPPPDRPMVAILMTQRLGFPQSSGIYLDFWTSAYQTIDD